MTAKYLCILPAVVIDATNKVIRIIENATTSSATLAEATYFVRGDAASGDLLSQIDTKLEAAGASTNTYTVAVTRTITSTSPTSTVSVSLASGSDPFGLLFANGSTTFDATTIGFPVTDTAVNGSAKTSTLSPWGSWASSDLIMESRKRDEYAATSKRNLSGSVRGYKRGGKYEVCTVRLGWEAGARIWEYENTADPEACLNRVVQRLAGGLRFEMHETTVSGSTLGALSSSTAVGSGWHLYDVEEFEPRRIEPGLALYEVELHMRGYVS